VKTIVAIIIVIICVVGSIFINLDYNNKEKNDKLAFADMNTIIIVPVVIQ